MPKGVYKHIHKPNLGKKFSEEHKNKLSNSHKGNKCYNWKGGNIKKKVSRLEFINNMKGEKNKQWKGGITPIHLKIRHSEQYKQWVINVKLRDNFVCQGCNIRKDYTEVHHTRKSFSKILRENNIKSLDDALKCYDFWDINNGVTLCKDCHKKAHSCNSFI